MKCQRSLRNSDGNFLSSTQHYALYEGGASTRERQETENKQSS